MRYLIKQLRYGLPVLLLLLTTQADAVTVSGKVLDKETGESIPGVAVQVKGLLRGMATSVEGLFSLADLPAGEVVLTLSALGYAPQEQPLTLTEGQDQHMIFHLETSAIEFKPVEVVAKNSVREERTDTFNGNTIDVSVRRIVAKPPRQQHWVQRLG